MTVAVVFPGQGSQSVGMLTALYEQYPVVADTFNSASDELGYDLWKLVSQGPSEDLNLTERTQPAMLTAGIAVYRAYRSRINPAPSVAAGHSLGEITALCAAGAIQLADAVKLTQIRGRLMQAAVPAPLGAMAAILMLDDDKVISACQESALDQIVEAVNFNCPGQVVIAGHAEAVERAMARCKELGAKRALRLPVSVPAHSSLLKAAAEQLIEYVEAIEIRVPEFKVAAIHQQWHNDARSIRQNIVTQLYSPVQWSKTIEQLSATGISQLIECGPGKVLTGLNKKILAQSPIQVIAIDDPDSLTVAVS